VATVLTHESSPIGPCQHSRHRRTIGVAVSVLQQAWQEIDEQRAFEFLRSQSQRSGRKLYDVAEAVVESHLLLVRRQAP